MSANKQQAVTVHINIPDGNANGVWIVDRDLEWNGSVIVCPRACFETARSIKQFNQPGVYILHRPADAENLLPKIYIGLADPIRERLDNHFSNTKKDWWEKVFVCIGDSGGKLNKTHIEHLESRMIQMAKLAKLCDDSENKAMPKLPTLLTSGVELVEDFLAKLLCVLHALGLNIFVTPSIPSNGTSGENFAAKMFFLNSNSVAAKGYQNSGSFVVLAGSEGMLQTAAHAAEGIIAFRNNLESKGVLKAENGRLIFNQDYPFSSPTAAAQVVLGRSSNGRIEWINDKGKSIKDLEIEVAKQPTTIDQESVAAQKKFGKRPNLDFVNIGVPIGSVLQSTKDAAFSATVVGSKKVKIGNEEMSLTEATRRALKLPSGCPIQPSPYWKCNGKLLHELYENIYGVGD